MQKPARNPHNSHPAKFLHRCILLLCLLVSSPLWAYTGQATDEAFAALLSMPGAAPENGKWNFDTPEDFEAGSEDKLITYLGKKKKAGADLNAYRHFGTLLHHAIRANQIKTARWLLTNGADPHKKLLRGNDDALTLSQQYKRTTLVSLLQSQYGMTLPASKPTPTPTLPPKTTLASAAGKTKLTFTSDADIAVARDLLQQSASASNSDSRPEYDKKALAIAQQWEAFAAQMPDAAYARLLDDDTSIGQLLQLFKRTPPRLQVALARAPVAVLQRHAGAAVAALASAASLTFTDDAVAHMRYTVAADSWRTLWRILGKTTAYSQDYPLAGRVQPDLWPELLASGYVMHDTESELACLPSSMNARDFKALWPRLEKTFPDIRQLAPQLVVAPYTLHSGEQGCWKADAAQTIDKLRFLTAQGVRAPIIAIRKGRGEDLSPELLVAMQPFIPSPGTLTLPRIVDRKPTCTFALTDVWYRALLGDAAGATAGDGYEQVKVETLQLIDLPGQTECAMVVGGWGRTESYPTGLVDNFTGPAFEPNPSCPDPQDRYEVWQQQGGRIIRLNTDLGGDDGDPYLIPVQDRITGRAYYVHSGTQNGRCHAGGRAPFTFDWQQIDGKWALLSSNQPAQLQRALLDQCNEGDNGLQCRGIAALSPGSAQAKDVASTDPKLSNWRDAFHPVNWLNFVTLLRTDQHKAYQAAILALDKPTLKILQDQGIPGQWTAQAINAVSDSNLPLAEKRKRMAWIFYDHRQLERALRTYEADLNKLVTWLPREDWRPLLNIFTEQPYMYVPFDTMRTAAQEKNLTDLACDLDHVRGLMCGETIEGQ